MAGPHGMSRPKPSNPKEYKNIIENKKIKNRKTINICTFNIRSLVHPSRKIELDHCLKQFKWDIIGLAEIKKEGREILETEDYILMYYGEKRGSNGVGFLISKHLKTNIIDFMVISDRVVRLDLCLNNKIMSIIQCYAPTETYNNEHIELFYGHIKQALKNTGKDTTVMGDFNCKIGQPTPDDTKVMGPWGYGKRNDRGKLLIEFCYENQLYIMNTLFKKNLKTKWTWLSPDGKTKNEIDYILTKNKSSYSDVQVINTLFPSDHRIVRAKYISDYKTIKSRKAFNNQRSLLNSEEKESLKKSFASVTSSFEVNNITNTYGRLIKTIQETTSKLSRKHKKEISPVTEDVQTLIQERNRLKLKENKSKSEKNKLSALYKLVKKLLKNNRNTYRFKIIEEELENRASVKKAQNKLDKTKKWIMALGKNKKVKTNRDNILEIASEFYQKLYENREIDRGNDETINTNGSDENIIPFLESEITNVIKHLKSFKSPGEDGITNEVLKTLNEPLTPILTKIFNEILLKRITPNEWNTSIITLLYKKGDPTDIGNYRPISLQQSTYKIFTTLLLRRMSNTLEANQPIAQAGFRPKFSTVDHIFTLTQIIERYTEYGKELYIGFIDYEKAFDSILHEPLWKALEEQGVDKIYIELMREIYKNSKALIKLERKGEPFPIKRGVRQGDPISPNLFTALLEHIFNKLDWSNHGLNINGEYLNNLRFADDIVLLAESHIQLEYMLNTLDEESQKCGLKMNAKKTVVMTNGVKYPIHIQSKSIEYVEEYPYLGRIISFKDDTSREIERRIKKAWSAYWSLKEVFKSKIPIKLKKKAMDTIILPTLLYGCQSWALTKNAVQKIQIFQRAAERSMLGFKLCDRIRNKDLRNITKIIDAVDMATKLKWRWAGHVARADDGRWAEKILHWYPRDQPRPRGRPKRRWRDDIMGVAGATWTRLAKQRPYWQRLEEAYAQKWAIPQ